MGRGGRDCSPADLLVSKLRVVLSRLDRARAAALRRSVKAAAPARVDSRLGRRDSLLLHKLLLADLLDDPLRRRTDRRRVSLIAPGGDCCRHLSRSGNHARRDGDQALGPVGGTTRARLLDRVRMGATRHYGPALERARLLTSVPLNADPAGELGRSLRRQLSDRRRQLSSCVVADEAGNMASRSRGNTDRVRFWFVGLVSVVC